MLFIVNFSSFTEAQNNNENIQFSLLTCEPGHEIYSLFGHTAIRFQNFSTGEDIVYNYGMFSFNTPNFVWRFIKGETDYELGIVPFYYFKEEYSLRNSAVYYQVLNLSSSEKQKLKLLLDENYLPINRTYRYNYFYDNCTTKARDKIEESINGKISYSKEDGNESFRTIIHQFTKNNAWDEFGIDMCLGEEADYPIKLRSQMFSPFYLFDSFKSATINRTDSIVPLVKESGLLIVSKEENSDNDTVFTPIICSVVVLLLVFILVLFEVKSKKIFWWLDLVLFSSQGLAGLIITFLFFFSVHPTVGSNWLILLFNPIPLFYLPLMIYKDLKEKKDWYHYVNVAYLTLFIFIMLVGRQDFNITILPLTISLIICSLGHLLVYKKLRK